MVKLSKRKKSFNENFSANETLNVEEAIKKFVDFPKVKFDETVELHFRLNIDAKNSEQMVRGTVVLPHGTGRKVRIAVFCKGENVKVAEEQGADFVGSNELIDKVTKGFLGFDCVIATPDMMRDLSKLGKILGPRGLMPSPKTGTVTNDIARMIKEVKAGRVEFKSDKQAGIHVGIGKRSFTNEQLTENAKFFIDALNHAKPASIKGALVKVASLSTTMGPGLRVSV
ncbi:MAG: 50S ribosomal protein L1 [Candidatus Omnitrophica bacterium]|nr:50S ribosomal protein L1 [Candidatus Omnitrophota bacterium]